MVAGGTQDSNEEQNKSRATVSIRPPLESQAGSSNWCIVAVRHAAGASLVSIAELFCYHSSSLVFGKWHRALWMNNRPHAHYANKTFACAGGEKKLAFLAVHKESNVAFSSHSGIRANG